MNAHSRPLNPRSLSRHFLLRPLVEVSALRARDQGRLMPLPLLLLPTVMVGAKRTLELKISMAPLNPVVLAPAVVPKTPFTNLPLSNFAVVPKVC